MIKLISFSMRGSFLLGSEVHCPTAQSARFRRDAAAPKRRRPLTSYSKLISKNLVWSRHERTSYLTGEDTSSSTEYQLPCYGDKDNSKLDAVTESIASDGQEEQGWFRRKGGRWRQFGRYTFEYVARGRVVDAGKSLAWPSLFTREVIGV